MSKRKYKKETALHTYASQQFSALQLSLALAPLKFQSLVVELTTVCKRKMNVGVVRNPIFYSLPLNTLTLLDR